MDEDPKEQSSSTSDASQSKSFDAENTECNVTCCKSNQEKGDSSDSQPAGTNIHPYASSEINELPQRGEPELKWNGNSSISGVDVEADVIQASDEPMSSETNNLSGVIPEMKKQPPQSDELQPRSTKTDSNVGVDIEIDVIQSSNEPMSSETNNLSGVSPEMNEQPLQSDKPQPRSTETDSNVGVDVEIGVLLLDDERKSTDNTKDEKRVKCLECEKVLSGSSSLSRHKKTHNNEKPFKCGQCDKYFSRLSSLKRHKGSHSEEKPFKCTICGWSCIQNSDLVIHQRTHTGEKPFACEQCGKSFGSKARLVVHNRVHTGEKPYKCPKCDRSFARKKNVIEHHRIHTGERPFTCRICKKAFRHHHSLKTHIKLHKDRKDLPDSGEKKGKETEDKLPTSPEQSNKAEDKNRHSEEQV